MSAIGCGPMSTNRHQSLTWGAQPGGKAGINQKSTKRYVIAHCAYVKGKHVPAV